MEWMALFPTWYGSYPHKAHRGEAQEAWEKLCPATKADVEARFSFLAEKVKLYEESEWAEVEDRKFIRQASRFLNSMRKELKYAPA